MVAAIAHRTAQVQAMVVGPAPAPAPAPPVKPPGPAGVEWLSLCSDELLHVLKTLCQ